MGARSGEQFLQGLRSTKRHLWLEGERVDDVTTHPALAGGARTLAGIFDRLRAFPDECLIADPETGNLGANAIVGGSAGIATGAALSAKMRGSGQVAVCFFGDGAQGQGVLYEVMNMAALWKLPVIYVCENNLYGEYTPCGDTVAGGDGTDTLAGDAGLEAGRLVLEADPARLEEIETRLAALAPNAKNHKTPPERGRRRRASRGACTGDHPARARRQELANASERTALDDGIVCALRRFHAKTGHTFVVPWACCPRPSIPCF